MFQRLRVLTPLTETQVQFPYQWLTTTCGSSSRLSNALFCLPVHLHAHRVYTDNQAPTHIHINKTNKPFKKNKSKILQTFRILFSYSYIHFKGKKVITKRKIHKISNHLLVLLSFLSIYWNSWIHKIVQNYCCYKIISAQCVGKIELQIHI